MRNQNSLGKYSNELDLALSMDIPSIGIDYAWNVLKKYKSSIPLNLTGLIWVPESVYDYLKP
jgi:hypothetical protein